MMPIPNRLERWSLACIILALCVQLLAGCAALPVASPTPTPEIPAPSIAGVTLWGAAPVAGERVDLRVPGWRTDPDATTNTLATTTTGTDGRFVFEDAPAGDWTLVAIWPDGEKSAGTTPPANTDSGEPVDTVIRMERRLALEEPAGATIGPTPMLRWSSLPEAAGYRVWTIDAGTTDLV